AQANGGVAILDEYVPLSAPDANGQAGGSSSVGSVAPNMTATSSDGVAVAVGATFASSDPVTVGGAFTADGSYVSESVGGAGISALAAYDNAPSAGSLTATFSWGVNHSAVGVILGYPLAATGSLNGQDTWVGADDTTAAHGGTGV